jgi:hypothetical protein
MHWILNTRLLLWGDWLANLHILFELLEEGNVFFLSEYALLEQEKTCAIAAVPFIIS